MTKSHNWKWSDISRYQTIFSQYNNNRRSIEMKRLLPRDDPHVTKKPKIENSNSELISEEVVPVVSIEETVEIPVISVKEESTDVKCEPASGKF